MGNLKDFAAKMRANQPGVFGKMPEARAVAVIRAVLREMGAQIDQADEGVVVVPSFGRFVVKKSALPDKPAKRQIMFRRAPPKKRKQKAN